MTLVKVVDPGQLDFEAHCRLQKDAYANLLEKNKASDDFMTPEFYRWKYAPPAGEAKIAVIYEKGRLVAANAMFPLLIRFQNQTIRGWQSCDTATHPLVRGKGYFVKCLHALIEELQEEDLFFGFPNRNAMRGFQKIGWIEIGDLTTWIKPYIIHGRIRPNPKIIEPQTFDERQDSLNQLIADARYPLLDRSADYMNWRYMKHPQCSYQILAYIHGGEWQGVAVFRQAQVMGKKWAMVMELWGLGASIERELLKEISRSMRAQNLNRVVMLNTGLARFNGIRAGFMPLPSRWAPKRNVLMGAANKGAAEALLTAQWCLRTGDWDVY